MIIFAGLISVQGRGGQPFVALMLAGFYFFRSSIAVNEAKRMSTAAQPEAPPGTRLSIEAEVDISRPTGSISWGIILILLGGLFLLANYEVISYDALIDYWPLALIGLGLKLLADYFYGKNQPGNHKEVNHVKTP